MNQGEYCQSETDCHSRCCYNNVCSAYEICYPPITCNQEEAMSNYATCESDADCHQPGTICTRHESYANKFTDDANGRPRKICVCPEFSMKSQLKTSWLYCLSSFNCKISGQLYDWGLNEAEPGLLCYDVNPKLTLVGRRWNQWYEACVCKKSNHLFARIQTVSLALFLI